MTRRQFKAGRKLARERRFLRTLCSRRLKTNAPTLRGGLCTKEDKDDGCENYDGITPCVCRQCMNMVLTIGEMIDGCKPEERFWSNPHVKPDTALWTPDNFVPLSYVGAEGYGVNYHIVRLDERNNVKWVAQGRPNEQESAARPKMLRHRLLGKVLHPPGKFPSTPVQAKLRLHDKIMQEQVLKCGDVGRELEAWKAINGHPNVQTLWAHFQTMKFRCFIVPYASESTDLHEVVEYAKASHGSGMDPSLLVRIAAQVGHVLHCLHSLGFVHRDICLYTISLGVHRNAIISSFAMCTYIGSAKGTVGSAEFCSPEMLNLLPYGVAGDWWSLGILIYWLITLKPPVSRKDPEDFCEDGCNRAYEDCRKQLEAFDVAEDPERDRLQCVSGSYDLLKRLLQPNPAKRMGARSEDFDYFKEHAFFNDFDWGHLDECGSRVLSK